MEKAVRVGDKCLIAYSKDSFLFELLLVAPENVQANEDCGGRNLRRRVLEEAGLVVGEFTDLEAHAAENRQVVDLK